MAKYNETMWVFTNRGLLSVVQDRDDASRLLVRARQRGLLESIVPRPDEVFHDGTADYPYRVFLSRPEFTDLLAAETNRIEYGNFKSSIRDQKYHDVCMRVWSAGLALQEK